MGSSIREIARLAGVSTGTVSLALQGHPRISAECRERIAAIARELDYVPSSLGRSLQSGRSGLVGYLLSSVQRSFYSDLLQGIGQSLSARGQGLLLAVTSENPDEEARQLRLFREKAIDGLILSNHVAESVPMIARMQEEGIPVVVCDYEPYAPDLPTVAMDETAAAALLVRHLAQLGHTRFACGCPFNRNGENRLGAIRQALSELGLPPPAVAMEEEHLLALASDRTSADAPTAILCYSDHMARQLLQGLRERGVRCPEDVSVTGYDDMEFSAWAGIELTTIRQPKRAMGEMAVELLLAQPGFGKRKAARAADGVGIPRTPDSTVSPRKPDAVQMAPVAPELVVRRSTGPAPDGMRVDGDPQA